MPIDFTGARRFRKTREATVEAHRLVSPRQWRTDHGDELVAKAGDWVLSDGEREWTVDADVFAETYQPVGDGRWWKSAPVDAVRVGETTDVDTLEGSAVAAPGDWVLRNPAGDVWPVTAAVFEETYELLVDEE